MKDFECILGDLEILAEQLLWSLGPVCGAGLHAGERGPGLDGGERGAGGAGVAGEDGAASDLMSERNS